MATVKKKTPSLWQRVVEWGLGLLDGGQDVPRHKRPQRPNATIARVRQVNASSCGVAAAAMFARQKHDVVKAFMFPTPRRNYGSNYEEIWPALTHFGVEHEERKRKFVSWQKIPSHALVHIRWKDATEAKAHHWVVFQRLSDGYRVIDPGSWGNTLTAIDLDSCEGVGYSLVTPRTREQGPLKVPAAASPKPRRKSAVPAKKIARRRVSKPTEA
jgi:hypothetical protein